MSLASNLNWVKSHVPVSLIAGKSVLDVGSRCWDATLGPWIKSQNPQFFIGVDMMSGPWVDAICKAEDLVEHFGIEKFDLVMCIEVLEHIRDWQSAIKNIKTVTKLHGTIVITTRTKGFPIHGYPNDYWRFAEKDLRDIFADCDIVDLYQDGTVFGIYVVARKLRCDLSDLCNICPSSVSF